MLDWATGGLTCEFIEKENTVKLKRILGYMLTTLIALWGLIYRPLQDMNALKPYTTNPLAALKYDPLYPVVLIPLGVIGIYFLGKIDNSETGNFSVKTSWFLSIWLVAVMWPMASTGERNQFIAKRQVWAGSCTIVGGIPGQDDRQIKIACENGQTTYIYRDHAMIDQLIRGKKLTCTINALQDANCHL